MATYVKGNLVPNATSYELYEKAADGTYSVLATDTTINFEVSALDLDVGDHILVVKAKADSYTDSDYSNEVTYNVPDLWVDITDQFTMVSGKMIRSNDGTVGAYTGWVANEEYVDLSAYSEIEIKMSKTSSVATQTGLAFYGADKSFISGVAHTDGVATYGVMIKKIALESNMKYIRTTYWDKTNANYKTEFGDFYCKAKLKS